MEAWDMCIWTSSIVCMVAEASFETEKSTQCFVIESRKCVHALLWSVPVPSTFKETMKLEPFFIIVTQPVASLCLANIPGVISRRGSVVVVVVSIAVVVVVVVSITTIVSVTTLVAVIVVVVILVARWIGNQLIVIPIVSIDYFVATSHVQLSVKVMWVLVVIVRTSDS